MSIAPNAGIVALDNFKEPTSSTDGLQGQVPKPLAGQQNYVLTGSGFVPGGSIPGLGSMATQNANSVAITGGAIDGTTVGATTPSTGSFTTLIGGAGSVNYEQITGGATTKAVQFQTLGSDANISVAFQPKGTGAIDLAAGSSGVNISNGGTITAITRTATGSNYTSIPSVAITAPTTVGGVQAIIAARMYATGATPVIGGTGYTLNDVVTLAGGTPTTISATYTVTAVSSGVVTAVTPLNYAVYSALPTNPVSVTGGTGTGLTLTVLWNVNDFTITTAGSGYVEQPTVSFSGGGGSGAAAYASVGGVTTIRSLGSGTTSAITLASLQFYTPNTVAPVLTLRDIGGADTGLLISPATGYVNLVPLGASNATMMLASGGTNSIYFNTQGTSQTNQMRVAHTASAVNYVQVTGAATGNQPIISAQGSDAAIILNIQSKGAANIIFTANAAEQFRTGFTASTVNSLQANGATAGNSPSLQARGSDTNIDLTLTPKGTGVIQFGTYTATILTPTGYINIKDSGGTVRRLLVG